MKRAMLIFCMVFLLFSGCAVQESPDTTDDTVQIMETQPGTYIPESDIENQTGGVVREFALNDSQTADIFVMGERLLVIDGAEQTSLKLYSGDRAVETASVQLPVALGSAEFIAYQNGCAYYLAESRELVFLDIQLSEVNRVQLPEGIYGVPVMSNDGSQIFYSVEQQLFAVDAQRKITRLLKTHESVSLELVASYMSGMVLSCRATYENGNVSMLYIDTETGQTIYENNQIEELYSYDNRFFGRLMDGTVEHLFFGTGADDIKRLNMLGGSFAPALEMNGVIRYEQLQDGILQLQFVDLNEGKITSQIELQGVGMPTDIKANRWKNCAWLLVKNADDVLQLLRWDIKGSAIADETVYTGELYTASNPDEVGLEECAQRAKSMGKSYGVVFRLWESAVKYPGDYVLEPEHQTAVINQCLDQLEVVLSEFPKKFLDRAISDQIRVCIVRSVDGETKAVRYWNGSSAYIVLSVGCDVRNGFIKGLSYVVDSHVLGNSSKYDYWNDTNPEGFSYTDVTTHSKSYIKGKKRAFVDELSMTSVVEDRSAIFYQAMQPDNQEMFSSDIMQNKLLTLCNAIRSAWSLRKSTEIFPWEQYLNHPIAAES